MFSFTCNCAGNDSFHAPHGRNLFDRTRPGAMHARHKAVIIVAAALLATCLLPVPAPPRNSVQPARMSGKRILALFDVDGTLTAARKVRHMTPRRPPGCRCWCADAQIHAPTPRRPPQKVEQPMLDQLEKLRKVGALRPGAAALLPEGWGPSRLTGPCSPA